MSRFYEELKNDLAVSKAKALKGAQVVLIKNPRYRHPFFWSVSAHRELALIQLK